MRLAAPHKPYGYSRTHRFLEIAGIAVFLALIVYLSGRTLQGIKGPADLLGVALAGVGGLLLADLFSGLVHWAGDTLLTANAPIVGRHFIGPFRQHHLDPKDITRHDFIETNGNNCLASVPVLGAMAPVMPAETGVGFYLCTIVVWTTWFVFGTNQFHKWAHQENPPRIALRLQAWGIILSPEHHAIHHTSPYDTHYCITNGWFNPLLARLRLFRGIEWTAARIWPSLVHLEERNRLPRGAGDWNGDRTANADASGESLPPPGSATPASVLP